MDSDGRCVNPTITQEQLNSIPLDPGTLAALVGVDANEYRDQQARQQWYNGLSPSEQIAFGVPVPFVFNGVSLINNISAGNWNPVADNCGSISAEAAGVALTFGMARFMGDVPASEATPVIVPTSPVTPTVTVSLEEEVPQMQLPQQQAQAQAGPPPSGSGAAENAPLANILEGHSAGQGFTGVYDASTGDVLIAPSTADAEIPAGWVARAGGHADVSAALGGDAASQSGFAVILQEDGTLNITWRSGTLNPPPDFVVPPNLRQTIINTVQSATGRTVNP